MRTLGLLLLAVLALPGAKLAGAVDLPWVLVFAPFWLSAAVVAGALGAAVSVVNMASGHWRPPFC